MSINRLASAVCVCAILLTGCSAPKKVPYLVDAETIPSESLAAISTVKDPTFVQGDLLNICIYASDPTAVAQFNKGQYLTPEGTISKASNSTNTAGTNTASLTDYYLVDAEGNIDYISPAKPKNNLLAKSRMPSILAISKSSLLSTSV